MSCLYRERVYLRWMRQFIFWLRFRRVPESDQRGVKSPRWFDGDGYPVTVYFEQADR
jgi:hypothetical protein